MTVCPRCGNAEDAAGTPELGPQKDLARVTTAAEAGYLLSLLHSAGLSATTRPVESFSAVTGVWSASHVLSVAEGDVAIAQALLRAESRGENLEEALGVSSLAHADSTAAVNPWRMLAVLTAVVMAGVFFTRRNFHDEPRAGLHVGDRVGGLPGAEPESLLPAALRQAPTPFYSAAEDGSRRRLAFSEREQEWTLSIDQDRDGRYETHRRFKVSPPVAAAAIDR